MKCAKNIYVIHKILTLKMLIFKLVFYIKFNDNANGNTHKINVLVDKK